MSTSNAVTIISSIGDNEVFQPNTTCAITLFLSAATPTGDIFGYIICQGLFTVNAGGFVTTIGDLVVMGKNNFPWILEIFPDYKNKNFTIQLHGPSATWYAQFEMLRID